MSVLLRGVPDLMGVLLGLISLKPKPKSVLSFMAMSNVLAVNLFPNVNVGIKLIEGVQNPQLVTLQELAGHVTDS
jgi:hypothetical protein